MNTGRYTERAVMADTRRACSLSLIAVVVPS